MMKKLTVLAALLVVMTAGAALAEPAEKVTKKNVPPPSPVQQSVGATPFANQELMQKLRDATLDAFWNNAVDSKGKLFEPASDLERSTLPVPEDITNAAIYIGMVSGIGEWCGQDVKPHYESFMNMIQRQIKEEKPVSFVSVAHGVGQGFMAGSLKEKGPCTAKDKEQITKTFKADIDKFKQQSQ